MSIAVLTLHLRLPGCSSLKEKRGHIKPILARLRREFNVATAEIGLQDQWSEAVLACVTISADPNQNHRLLLQAAGFVERSWPNLEVIDQRIELI